MTTPPLSSMTDDVLVETLKRTCREANRLLAQLLLLLIEVEDREIYAVEAYPSLFEYCRGELGMSEGEAFRRIAAARLVRRLPRLLPRIERGHIHLTALVTLRDYFTEENLDELVDTAKGRNKLQLSELVARLSPRPGTPPRLRKLPQHDKGSRVTDARRPNLEALAEALYRLQVTGNRAFRDKILRARDLMMHSNPSGDLSVVIDRALDKLIDALERQQFGKPLRKMAEASLEEIPASKAVTGNGHAAKNAGAGADVHTTADDEVPAPRKTKSEKKKPSTRPGLARASTKPSVAVSPSARGAGVSRRRGAPLSPAQVASLRARGRPANA